MKKLVILSFAVFGIMIAGNIKVDASELSYDESKIENSIEINPRIWASHTQTSTTYYYGYNAYIPDSINYRNSFGQSGVLYKQYQIWEQSTGRWRVAYKGTVSGYI